MLELKFLVGVKKQKNTVNNYQNILALGIVSKFDRLFIVKLIIFQ